MLQASRFILAATMLLSAPTFANNLLQADKETKAPEVEIKTVGKYKIGDRALNIQRDSVLVMVVAIEKSGSYVVRFDEGTLNGKVGGGWGDQDLAQLSGCGNARICVNDLVYNISRDAAEAKVVGIQHDGKFVLRFDSGTLQGKKGSSWDVEDLALPTGCGGKFCVGQEALNISRDYASVRIVAIQHDKKYVVKFLTGTLAGKFGHSWEDSDLAKTHNPK